MQKTFGSIINPQAASGDHLGWEHMLSVKQVPGNHPQVEGRGQDGTW